MHDLGGFIRDQRRMARLSLRKLSELAGISNPYLSQIERGLRKPSAEILQAIARALRISAETLYVRAGILEAREGDSDVVAEILRDTTITERQKQVLIEIYRSFQRSAEPDAVFPGASGAPARPPPGSSVAWGCAPRRPCPVALTEQLPPTGRIPGHARTERGRPLPPHLPGGPAGRR